MVLLARPSNIQVQGGFPTKLGEYLATGNPVVVTKVGEIPDYLIDGENAFLSDPDSPDSFSKKLMECLNDADRSMKIGLEGQKLALKVFNYKVQGQNIIEFIKDIKRK